MLERVLMGWYRRQMAQWQLLERVRTGSRIAAAEAARREPRDHGPDHRASVIGRSRRH